MIHLRTLIFQGLGFRVRALGSLNPKPSPGINNLTLEPFQAHVSVVVSFVEFAFALLQLFMRTMFLHTLCRYIYIYAQLYLYIYMYVNTFIHSFINAHTYIHIYIHPYIHTFAWTLNMCLQHMLLCFCPKCIKRPQRFATGNSWLKMVLRKQPVLHRAQERATEKRARCRSGRSGPDTV